MIFFARSRQLAFIIGIVLISIVFMAFLFIFRGWYLDDAFISMRYARNWAGGVGLVFNPCEYVEGYTNFGWVALLAIGFRASLNVPLFARLMSIFFGVSILVLLAVYIFKNSGKNFFILFSVMLTAVCNGDFSAWSNSAMETTMFSFFVFAGAVFFISSAKYRVVWSSVFFVMALFTRPEGSIFIGVSLVYLLLKGRKNSVQHYKRDLLLFLFPLVLLYMPYFFIRWQYYGYLLPNTFYAKVGGSFQQIIRGMRYTGGYVFDQWFVIILSVWGYCLYMRRYGYIISLIGVYCLYVICVGGDIFPAYRFFIPMSPFVWLGESLFFTRYVKLFRAKKKLWILYFVIGFCIFMQVVHIFYRHDYKRLFADDVSFMGRKIGLWMRAHIPSDTVIALNAVGSVPYYSRLTTVDMLGLTDEHLAHTGKKSGAGWAGHELGNGEYVLSRNPDIVVFSGPWGDDEPLFKGDYDLYYSQKFKTEYMLYSIPIDNIIFQCYVRKSNHKLTSILNYYKIK